MKKITNTPAGRAALIYYSYYKQLAYGYQGRFRQKIYVLAALANIPFLPALRLRGPLVGLRVKPPKHFYGLVLHYTGGDPVLVWGAVFATIVHI